MLRKTRYLRFLDVHPLTRSLGAAAAATSAGGAVDVVTDLVQRTLCRGLLCVLLYNTPGISM